MEGSAPSSDSSDDALERAFYTELRDQHTSVVPVIGSGLTIPAGAPGFRELIAHLIKAAKDTDTTTTLTAENDPFEVVEALASELGDSWVQDQTAGFYISCTFVATPALRALAKVDSGLIITTNYDLAIEDAARAVGRDARSLTLDEFDQAMRREGQDELLVLHLHGIAIRPETIVLTKTSYETMMRDERAQLLMRSLGLTSLFVFLGHRLSGEEKHLRRDLRWAFDAASDGASRRHLLVTNRETVDDDEALEFKDDLETHAGIRVVMFPDAGHCYQAAVRTAHVIGGQSLVAYEDSAPVVPAAEVEPHYLPPPVGEAEELRTPGGYGAYLAHVWQRGETSSLALDVGEDRLVLEAAGGAGKTQELLQIAKRSSRPALLQTLRSIQVEPPWSDPGLRFVTGMTQARAVRPGIGRLTIQSLRDESYVFLLDGLDEVPAAHRGKVLQLVLEVAAAYPQHRYVMGSRPLPELRQQTDFSRWTPVTDMTWVQEYAQSRGVTASALEAALPATGDVRELILIPIFAAAVIDRIYAGQPLPQTAIDLICTMADARAERDTRIEADPAALRVWLDRIALALQLTGTAELTLDGLIAAGLHQDLDGIAPTEELLIDLVARALLVDANGSIRFPANVIKEARAARALLEAGDAGLALIRRHVLVELEATDLDGNRIRTVQPSWVNVLEMLLPKAPAEWKAAVAAFDETLEARTVATDAEEVERFAAVETLWNTYIGRRIWLERGVSAGNGSGDADAVVRLLRKGYSQDIRDKILAAATNSEREIRGNAMEVIPHVTSLAEALQLLTVGVTDPDSVVRRRAAAAGWELDQLYELDSEPELVRAFIGAMVDQAGHDDDESAAQTLVTVAMDLAGADSAVQIALDAPPPLQGKALSHLVSILPRAGLLRLLLDRESLHEPLFLEIVEDRGFRSRESWLAPDIVMLAELVAKYPEQSGWLPEADEVLSSHPAIAILALIRFPLNDETPIHLRRIVASLTDVEITALLDILDDPQPELLAAAGWPNAELATDEGAAGEAREYLTHALDTRHRRPSAESAPMSASTLAVDTAGRDDDLADNAQAEQELRGLFASDGVATAYSAATRSIPWAVHGVLHLAAARQASLSVDETVQLFRLMLDWIDGDLEDWLSSQWSDSARAHVDELVPHLSNDRLVRLAAILPGPWPTGLGAKVLQAADGSDLRLGLQLTAAGAVADKAGESVVRSWAAQCATKSGDRWIDRLLVRLGDCEAERRLLAKLATETGKIMRYPMTQDEEWISSVRCESSVESLEALIKAALIAGVGDHELEPIYRALNRCAGLDSPQIWEHLSADSSIPAATFLYYQRRVAIGTLLETQAPLPSVGDPDLRQSIVEAVELK